jgi:hypothetical protein
VVAHDAATPDAPADAPPDAPRDTGTDAPPTITFVCPQGNTTDCSKCVGRPLGCVMCGQTGIYAVCVPLESSCYADYKPQDYDWCRCALPDASACVLPDQGCNSYSGGVCVTCGERQTDGDPCKGGGRCNEAAHACQ